MTFKKVWFKSFQYEILKDGIRYKIKKINLPKQSILSINSKYIWEIKYGTYSNRQMKTTHSRLIDLETFLKEDHTMILLSNTPFDIQKYINENEVISLGIPENIDGIRILYDLNEFI
jgi:hypothetical protein